MKNLITKHIDLWTTAQTPKTNGAGRGNGSAKQSLYGIKKLRGLILELAVRGKLVPQDPNDEPASALLEKIAKEKARLIKEGKIKKEESLPDITEDEKPLELPKGWEYIRIGNTINMVNGRAFKPSEWSSSGLRIIRIQNLNDSSAPYNYCDFDVDSKILISDGDFLISWSGTPGTSFGAFIWNRGPAVLNQHIFRCELYGAGFFTPYLRLAINAELDEMISHAHGAVGLQHITKGKLENLLITLPPLTEQHRIVAKVDELMAFCDQLEQKQTDNNALHQTLVETLLSTLTSAVNSLEFSQAWQRIACHFDILFTTNQSIDQFKQTILQLAVMGKLVPQDPNDEPASVLMEKIAKEKARLIKEGKIKKQEALPEIFAHEKPFEVPVSWSWARIGALMDPEREISYGIIKLEKEPLEGGIPTIRCSDVKSRYIDLSSVRNVSPEIEEPFRRTRLRGGEVLINIRGTLGGVALVPPDIAGYNIAREVAMLPIAEDINGQYAVTLIASPFFWQIIQENIRGMAYKGLNLKILRELAFPLPPKSEQHRIVSKVDELMALCDKLKARLKDAQTTQVHLADAIVEQAVT